MPLDLSSCQHLTQLVLQDKDYNGHNHEVSWQADFGHLPKSLHTLVLADLVPNSISCQIYRWVLEDLHLPSSRSLENDAHSEV